MFVVPGVSEARLTLMNSGTNPVTYALNGSSSSLAAGAMITRLVSPGTYTLVAESPLFAAISIRGETVLGHFQVLPTPPSQEPIRVSVR